ncbi:fungal-specific transcription factor domain-containing protein [Mycena epipterygia]|nr:fungal-specific transcription factor domain-containing protein [Mycena epipterygia]
MPKGIANPRVRGPYAVQACTICRSKKSKCDGVKPVCGSCAASGREDECSWGRDTTTRKPRTEAHFEALRKRAESLQAYADLLEGIIAKCVCQDVSSHLQFRPQQPGEQSGKEGGDSDTDVLDSDEEITQELTVPAQCLKLDDNLGGLLVHGITAPFRFGNRPPNEVSRITPDVFENPNASYVLLVDGVDVADAHPHIDWSRHLPPEVALDRKEHDKIIDLSLKFFTMWCLRIVPSLFLRDMYRALSVPRSQQPPRTPHYSPMLHNAFLALAALYSNNPYIRDLRTRQHFVDAAQKCLESEYKKPDLALVHALAFLGTHYTNEGERIPGDLHFGMSSRLSLSLGLGVDCRIWVKSGLITHDEMVGRNCAYWSVFSMDVCWALYFGRDFCGPAADRCTIPLPFVDSEFDQIPWYYAPANIPPQPNYLTLTFFESSRLFVIIRNIVDIVSKNGLGKCTARTCNMIKTEEQVSKIDLQLNNWRSSLPPELQITLANRGKSTPHRLLLHLQYWWSMMTLHRPFFHQRQQSIQHSDREIDHVKLCKRGAENTLELLETWSSLYTLRYSTVTMLQQVVFAAGTVFLLLALQATASLRVAHGSLTTALAQVEQCVRYLYEIGETWKCAKRTGDILGHLLNDKLRPVIARRLAHRGGQSAAAVVSSSQDNASVARGARPGNPDQPSLLPVEPPTIDWNPPDEEWAQMPLDLGFFAQSLPGDPYSESCTGETAFPELAGFLLPTFDRLDAPELWEQDLFRQ